MGTAILVTGIISGFLITLVAVFVFIFQESFVTNLVTKSVQLIPSTELYKNWLNPPFDIYMNIYLYNLKNPDEFENGAKPLFEEIGPFVYKEVRLKENIVDNLNYTITYIDRRYYSFLPELSKYPESYPITTLNMPAVTILNYIQNSSDITHELVNAAFKVIGETVIINKSAGEIIWGYQDKFLSFIHSIVPNLVPDTAGLFYGQNYSSYGQFTIFTGEDDISKLGVIERFNGRTEVTNWSNKYANMINGTDGSLSKPFMKKTEKQFAFQSTLCRSLYGYFNKTARYKDYLDLWVISANEHLFANASVNPENAGFCTPPGHCLGSGVFDMSTCTKMGNIGVPIVLSNPHYLFADPKYPAQYDGLSPPNEDLHNTKVFLDPLTGIEFKAHQRLQFNANLINDSQITAAKNFRSMFFPLMWVDENFDADDATVKTYYYKSKVPLLIINILKYIFLVCGTLLFLLCVVFLVIRIRTQRKQNKGLQTSTIQQDEQQQQPSNWIANETTPLLLN